MRQFNKIIAAMFSSIAKFSDMIKLGHTLFALPFALSAMCLAYKCGAKISWREMLFIFAAFVFARAFAMAFNRIVDRKYDAKNPRTAMRHIPSGAISLGKAKSFTLVCAVMFCLSALALNTFCFWLSFLALAILAFYSYTKRFTFFAHFVLGFAIGMCPMGVSAALFGKLLFAFAPLSLALMFHIGGFDILYAMQDTQFDIKAKLHSIPSTFGNNKAKIISAASFTAASFCLVWLGVSQQFSVAYFAVISLAILTYFAEHIIVRLTGLKNIDIVFFHMNVAVSVLIFIAMACACLF